MKTDRIKTLCKIMDKDLEKTKDLIIAHLGGDPGHDIGDAGYALEILTNIATEHAFHEVPDYVKAIQSATKTMPDYILGVLYTIACMPQDKWNTLFKDIYPGEYPFSGFSNNTNA